MLRSNTCERDQIIDQVIRSAPKVKLSVDECHHCRREREKSEGLERFPGCCACGCDSIHGRERYSVAVSGAHLDAIRQAQEDRLLLLGAVGDRPALGHFRVRLGPFTNAAAAAAAASATATAAAASATGRHRNFLPAVAAFALALAAEGN